MQLASNVLDLSSYFVDTLRPRLSYIPRSILSLLPHLHEPFPQSCTSSHPKSLPSPIIAILTTYPRPLSSFLHSRGMNARPITWPTVPKGKDRVRVCLHAGNTWEEVDNLINTIMEWAEDISKQNTRGEVGREGVGMSQKVFLESKL